VPDLLTAREPWLAAAALLLVGALAAAGGGRGGGRPPPPHRGGPPGAPTAAGPGRAAAARPPPGAPAAAAGGAPASALTRRIVGDRERAGRLAAGSVWAVLAIFAIAALSRLLGPEVARPGLATAATRLFARFPDVLIALLLVVLGLILATGVRLVARRLLAPVQPGAADLVASVAYWTVVGVAVLLAAEQVGIRTGLVQSLALILLGGVVLAAALALGLGARDLVSAVVAGRHAAQVVGVGDEVEVAGRRGVVRALGHASVRLAVGDSDVEVPNRAFLEDAVVVHRRAPTPEDDTATMQPGEPA
jgi:hypothetical protein